ncbi:MAG: hypothetical protein U9O98_08970 [Asgard group archaeon]|nr:hypothetical protein [Asgard group archaeon]
MVRIINNLTKQKKGQLFLIEVFIALTVIILLMTAIYQVEFTTYPHYQEELSTIGFDALETLNEAGELKPLIFEQNSITIQENLDNLLEENILWRLSVLDNSSKELFTINWEQTPPLDTDIGVVNYILASDGSSLGDYRIIHLELWQLIR